MHAVLSALAVVIFAITQLVVTSGADELRNLADPAAMEEYGNALKNIKTKSAREADLFKKMMPVASAKAVTDPPQPPVKILGISTDDGSQVATTSIVVPTPDILSTDLTLMLVDAVGGIIDIGSKSSNDDTPITLTVGPGPNKGTGPVDAIAKVNILYKTGGTAEFSKTIKGAVFPSNVTNLAPIITNSATSNDWIQVCIDRATASTAAPPACNYVFGSVPKPPGAMVPLQGSIKYPGAIDVDSRGKPAKAEATLLILNGDATGACRYIDLGNRFFSDPNTKAVGDTLSWSIDPAVFASSCPDAEAIYTFALAVKVNVADKPSWGTISNAIKGTTKTSIAIPKLQVVAGCIAAGTLVTLGSGGTKAVEALKVGDQLKSQNYTLTLAAIASGNENRIVTISTDAGATVTLSLIHPVITERGAVQARDLQLDDVLTTASGKAKIVKLVQEVLAKPIEVYDLVLTPPAGSVQQGWTLFAGDLLVGDGAMKAAIKVAAKR